MSSDRWDLLQNIFHRAMELAEDQRLDFVARECGSDSDLHEELVALIGAEAEPASLIDSPLGEVDSQADLGLEGEVIGAYRLIRRIGSGGMGSVFLAERADGSFERQVALKVVKKGMDTEQVVQRFRMERQILARLDHPNIASLLDGGVTADGRPYFVMEHVDGVPITEYCDTHQLGVADRLRLFEVVCDSVQYAHQSLLVHRDLKPSNILVTTEGEVRLLDFGIAKLLDQSEDQGLTGTGALLATPAYAAPEQLVGDSITTMTDIYALGVLLYELLAGRRPFETNRSVFEYRELVVAGNPVRPSTAITQIPVTEDGRPDHETVRKVAAARGLQVARLRAVLKGDLDTICLMALRREPAMRYSSAAQMAGDVQRHRDGLPVVARPDTIAYRLGKFVRRNRAGVAGSSFGVLAFLGLAGFYTVELARERDVALDEQAKTREVVEFVTGLFRVADPAQSRGADVTARELLDAGRKRVESELDSRPSVRSTMMRVLGEVYYELGSNDDADRLLEGALNQQLELYGPKHLETATTYLSLGMNQQTVGDFAAAEDSIGKALETRRNLLGDLHYDTLEALAAQAFLEETTGDYAKAEQTHLEALRLAQRLTGGQDDAYLAKAMAQLASIYRIQDRPDEAEPLLRGALEMQDRVYGGAHPESDETKRQLAELLGNTRRFDEAEGLYKELIESRTRMMGPDHYELGSTWNSYGHLLAAKGDADGAMSAYRRMMDITERAYDGKHPALAAGYNNLAILQRNKGDLDAALESYRQSIAMQDAVGLEPRHPLRAYPITGIARVHILQRRFSESEQMLMQAMELRRPHFDEEHVLIIELKSDLGAVLQGLGRFEEAEESLRDAYRVFEREWGVEDSRTALTAARLVILFERTGRPEAAGEYRGVASDPNAEVMLR